MLPPRSYACVTALLAACAGADWVEISQQHYKKPMRFDRPVLEEQTPTRITPDVLHAPDIDHFLQKAQYPTKTFKDVDSTRNVHLYHEETQDPMRDSLGFDLHRPQSHRNQAEKPVRFNPFLDEIPEQTRNTYNYQHLSNNKYNIPNTVKPVRDFPSDDDPFPNPTSETYVNDSIFEHNWNQNIRLKNNIRSNTKLTTKEPIYKDFAKNSYEINYGKPDERRKHDEEEVLTEKIKFKEEQNSVTGKIERVSNIGNVKRVHLPSTPVKSPTVKINNISETPLRGNDVRLTNMDDYTGDLGAEPHIFKNTQQEQIPLQPSKKFNRVFSTTEMVEQDTYAITHVDPLEETKATIEKVQIPSKNVNKPYIKPNQELTLNNPEADIHNWRHQNASIVDDVKSINNQPTDKTSTNYKENIFLTKSEKVTQTENKEHAKTNVLKSNLNVNRGSIEYVHDEVSKPSSEGGEKTSGQVKVNTMEKLLKFMKVVADTISKNTNRGANGKITFLNELKHSLLTNIKDRIDAAWPDEEGSRRRSRAARGHVEFPSSESALMTISFLTFAVFLVKLVLQVIQTYKHKTMLMAPLMVTTAGRTVSKKLRATT